MLLHSACYDVPEIPKQKIGKLGTSLICMKRDAKITFNKINQAAHEPVQSCPLETCTNGNFTYCA